MRKTAGRPASRSGPRRHGASAAATKPTNRSIGLDDSLYAYLCETTLREPKLMARLRAQTSQGVARASGRGNSRPRCYTEVAGALVVRPSSLLLAVPRHPQAALVGSRSCSPERPVVSKEGIKVTLFRPEQAFSCKWGFT
jgi:hypothetical protein